MLYSIGLLISVIFLLATLATGFILPSNHHVLHWRCQTFYVGCLLVGDLLLAMNQIFGAEISRLPCFSLGKFANFVSISTFSISSVLNRERRRNNDPFESSLSCRLAPMSFPILNDQMETEIEEMTSFFYSFSVITFVHSLRFAAALLASMLHLFRLINYVFASGEC